jgi:hypothetical protein
MTQWYCHVGGQQYGPVSIEDLCGWVRQGRLTASDLVWAEGMADWAPASSVSELEDALGDSGAPTGEGPSPPPIPPAAMGPAPAGLGHAVRPHRGGAVLALGILGLVVCFICGLIAWSMGNTDLKEMAAGRMDRSGEAMTQAGKICGMISTILAIAGLAVFLLWLIIMGIGFATAVTRF